ncbi:YdiK family protein [Alkalibacillus haloalkaliphilus]|uniref:YdiK family protein n=1 Tax=Alkalibacillus haloalkaliphilus TaxID=94136 RepID=UPI0002DF7B33|nr:YdiK family protein [Alkalibacillus haloalkaliphilus]
MKLSPLFLAWVYLIMGALFVYIGIQYADETVWNFATIIFALIATIDFVVAIRLFGVHSAMKNKKDQ